MMKEFDLFAAFDEENKATTASKVDYAEAKQDPTEQKFAPLAARLRPQCIEEYLGQDHLFTKGKALYEALKKGQCFSMILWGPPGVGKTTLSLLIAREVKAELIEISAVSSGVKDIREAIDKAQANQARSLRTILFVDEVHRFNKSQQDAFLPYIEDGTIIFIGATTENPSFELNKALLSRARIYVLKRLSNEDLNKLIDLALSSERGLKDLNLSISAEARDAIIDLSNGDARHLLNSLEMASELAHDGLIDLDTVKNIAGAKAAVYDKGGDAYYDLISALHKSVRGSAPQAALYWYARILDAGGDPLYVARRLLAIATEDVGLADPNAMNIAINAFDIYKRVGDAEGQRAIAEALVYLSLAPKSNALYQAFKDVQAFVAANKCYDVPMYLRNAPTKLMENLGYGEGYRYAHNYEHAYAAGECYLPAEIKDQVFYKPNQRGLEIKLQEKIDYLANLDNNSSFKRY